jgi:ankyrin repeat protein
LDETYERILLEIDEEKREYAVRLLQCLAFSRRPLHVKELAEAIAVELGAGSIPTLNVNLRPGEADEAVLSACSTLVAIIKPAVYNNDVRLVQFSHYSVKEFLTSDRLANSNRKDLSQYYISPEPAHTILAQTCISTLLQPDIDIGDITDSFPLAEYAAQNWFHHAQCDVVASQILDGMDRLFDPDRRHFTMWISIHDIDDHRPLEPSMKIEASPLYYAALCGIESLVEHLVITRRQDPNQSHGKHGTPLLVAIVSGHTRIVRVLLEHAADVNGRNTDHDPPLVTALTYNRLDIAHLLLSHEADINAFDSEGFPALYIAVLTRNLNVLEFLLKGGANVNPNGQTLLVEAAGNLYITQLLITHGADVNALDAMGHSPLYMAAQHQKLDVVKLLFKSGANALHEAVGRRNLDIVQLLLSHGADVNYVGHWKGSVFDQLRRLYQEPAGAEQWQNIRDAPVYDLTPLHAAADSGDLDIVRSLISHGADINALDSRGDSPLFKALRSQKLDVVELLLKGGANVNVRNIHNSTPLHLASLKGSLDISRLLIEHGADVVAQDDEGRTPFSIAMANGHLNLARFLSNDRVPGHDAHEA